MTLFRLNVRPRSFAASTMLRGAAFQTLLPEPSQFFFTGYALLLLLWLLHKISPAVDVVRAFGAASPLLTYRLPVSQLATAVALAAALLLIALKAVERREY